MKCEDLPGEFLLVITPTRAENYIHQNPIQEKWNLIDLPENYGYSSASFYIENKKSWSFLTHYYDEM
jgi:hypothetical protein